MITNQDMATILDVIAEAICHNNHESVQHLAWTYSQRNDAKSVTVELNEDVARALMALLQNPLPGYEDDQAMSKLRETVFNAIKRSLQ